jgi:hypothetical protein
MWSIKSIYQTEMPPPLNLKGDKDKASKLFETTCALKPANPPNVKKVLFITGISFTAFFLCGSAKTNTGVNKHAFSWVGSLGWLGGWGKGASLQSPPLCSPHGVFFFV